MLVVEDDRLMQEVIADYFGSKDWQVTRVDNGEDALELIKTNLYQLILLDVMLPGLNGFAVCRRIRKSVIFRLFSLQRECRKKINSTGMPWVLMII